MDWNFEFVQFRKLGWHWYKLLPATLLVSTRYSFTQNMKNCEWWVWMGIAKIKSNWTQFPVLFIKSRVFCIKIHAFILRWISHQTLSPSKSGNFLCFSNQYPIINSQLTFPVVNCIEIDKNCKLDWLKQPRNASISSGEGHSSFARGRKTTVKDPKSTKHFLPKAYEFLAGCNPHKKHSY